MTWADIPKACDRCGDHLWASIMSKFNQQTLCMACAADEKLAPGYEAADEAECAAVRGGNYRYPGVGLSGADRAFLHARRQARKAAQP